MKVRHVVVILAILVNMLFGLTAVAPSAGDGTSGDPYQIASFENLYWIQQNSSTWDKYFIQTADIDASASSTLNDGAGWNPIGPDYNASFKGYYDGQGYVIDGLYANRPTATDKTGLFGYIWNENSEIKNIHLTNMDITGNEYVGAIAGVAYAKINNCTSTGEISGGRTVGGLAGSTANGSPMNNCYSTATVSGTYYVGGLVGSSESMMQMCYFTGSATGGTYTGGLVGQNFTPINDCYCKGIIAGDNYVGGQVGYNNSSVEDSYFSGSISGTSNVGGLVGYSDDMMGFPEVDNCIWNTDTISTSIGSGWNYGTNYGKTTAEMKIQSTYTSVSWDFTTIWSMDADTNNSYPYFPSNPPLGTVLLTVTAIAPSAGDGTSGDPYQIASFDNLYWVQQNSSTWDKYFIQTADIDASGSSTLNDGAGWNPIGPYYNASFTGYYDGQGYAIDGLYANRPTATDYTGLFGQIWNSNSEIKNIHLTHMDITGNDYVGAIAGVANAKIDNCSSSGSISGGGIVGGLVGATSNGCPVNNCYSTATVSGSDYVGGLVGSSESLMQTCYFNGSVSGTNNIGGLIGSNTYSISDCYNKGSVSGTNYVGGLIGIGEMGSNMSDSYFSGSINGTNYIGGIIGRADESENDNCIWNSDTISTGIGSGYNFGTSYGKTTAEMKIQSTYTAISWDFTTIWSMDADTNNSYPYFSSNPPSETALPICLSEFNAEAQNGCILLTWRTESETDNACFLIYRNNEVIKSIEGAGTTTEPHSYRFIDDQVIPGYTYTYVLADISYANEETKYTDLAVTVTTPENDIPSEFALEANYPNPFNPITMIDFKLSKSGDIDLSVYDMTGKIVANLIHGNMEAGFHQTSWNASGFVSGIYFYRLTADEYVETKKMVLMK